MFSPIRSIYLDTINAQLLQYQSNPKLDNKKTQIKQAIVFLQPMFLFVYVFVFPNIIF